MAKQAASRKPALGASQELEVGYLAQPASGPYPAVVLIPDVWGLSDHYRDLAARLAREGFAVLALDPYRKTGQPTLTDPASAMAWIGELSDPLLLDTVQDGIDFLAEQPGVEPSRIGVTGFCMGGQYAILAACGCRGIAACVPFYGMLRYATGLDPARKPRSPLEALGDLRCPLLGLYGEQDSLIPVADVRALEAAHARAGVAGEIRLYPGAGHAFMNESRPAMHHPQAAQDAWPRMVGFFQEHLGAPA